MFRKVLVANRGEIAVRILRTLREMGIVGVAVYSDADRDSPHVAAADEAVPLGDPEPARSYLDAGKLIEVARSTGCEAIHPGYGFLSESPAFARAVLDAGLVFIGPPADVMALLADKTAARRVMAGAGVPVIPGTFEPAKDPDALEAEARRIGFPVLVKAALGGGGKGMRVVDDPERLREAVVAAASEALAAFGDGRVYLEKRLRRPRHVEFQILADAHGGVVHLFERECSLQRRHQKVVEESPSLALDDHLREAMGRAAVTAARAAGYVGAGTVEFLLDEGRYYFLEVNARLQVEHPVTEMRTGLDLVRRQLEVAAGLPLPFRQEDMGARGHAIECRIYAEDPTRGFAPCPGRVLAVQAPAGPGVRFDAGVVAGTEVSVHYDPILAKVAVLAEDRPAAIARMVRALEECVILGVETTIEFLIALVGSEAFGAGEVHTGFLEEFLAGWTPDPRADEVAALGCRLEGLAGSGPGVPGAMAADAPRSAKTPWRTLKGFGR